MASGRFAAAVCRMRALRAMAGMRPAGSLTSGSGMGMSLIASGDAVAAVLERASVMTAEVSVIADRYAVGDVSVAVEEYGSPVPRWRPGGEAPVKAGVNADRDSRIEGICACPHDAGRRRQHNESGIRDEQRAPDLPGIVIRNEDHSRIHRNDFDETGGYYYALLRGGDENVRLLSLQAHRLDGVHDVSGLVVIGVAKLRGPGVVFRQIVEDGGKLNETLYSRIPVHGVGAGSPLIRREIHILVEPGIGGRDLVGIGRSGQDLSDQGVRIESDRSHQLIELYCVQIYVRRGRSLSEETCLSCQNQQQGKHHGHHFCAFHKSS